MSTVAYAGDIKVDYNTVVVKCQVWGNKRVNLKFKVGMGAVIPGDAVTEASRRGVLAAAAWKFLTDAKVAGILKAQPLMVMGFQNLRHDAEPFEVNRQNCEGGQYSYKGIWSGAEAEENEKVGRWSISAHRGVPADSSNTLWNTYVRNFLNALHCL